MIGLTTDPTLNSVSLPYQFFIPTRTEWRNLRCVRMKRWSSSGHRTAAATPGPLAAGPETAFPDGAVAGILIVDRSFVDLELVGLEDPGADGLVDGIWMAGGGVGPGVEALPPDVDLVDAYVYRDHDKLVAALQAGASATVTTSHLSCWSSAGGIIRAIPAGQEMTSWRVRGSGRGS